MTFTLPTLADVLAFFKWIVVSGWTQLVALYNASHKWFAIGVAAFIVLVMLGYVTMPKVPAKDSDLENQVAVLSEKIDRLSANIDALKAPPVTPAVALKKKR